MNQINKLTKTLILSSMLFSLLISGGCKKENSSKIQDVNTSLTSDRLSLSKSDFNSIYLKLRKSELKTELKEFKNISSSKDGFLSLSKSTLDSKPSKTALSLPSTLVGSNKLQSTTNIGKRLMSTGPGSPSQTTPTYDEVLVELVDDGAFATLLNQDGEIQVDDIIYKVTPYGTFFAPVGSEMILDSVFAKVAMQNDYLIRLEDNYTELVLDGLEIQNTTYNDVRLLNKNVFFVDSFIEDNLPQPEVTVYPADNLLDPIIYPNLGGPPISNDPPPSNIIANNAEARYQSNFLTNNIIMTSPATSDPAYQNNSDYDIEFKRGASSVMQTFFTNSTRYNNFNSDYRISALMYNRNYGVLKTIGVKVKCQKKGWLWWNKTDAQEIRAGWDYMAYTSSKSIPKVTLPSSDFAPSIGEPYLINPTEQPFYGVPIWGGTDAWAKRYNMYGWYMKRGSNELFTIAIPGGFIPFKPDGLDIPASKFKNAVYTGWEELKKVLRKSAPPSGPSLTNNDPDNYKFPIHSLNGQEGVKYLSINDMENMPKSYTPTILKSEILSEEKIHTFVSPYEVKVFNNDMIDIPLDFSVASVTLISTDPSKFALNIKDVAKSLLTEELAASYDVKGASIFGAVKWNNQWRSIRLRVRMKD